MGLLRLITCLVPALYPHWAVIISHQPKYQNFPPGSWETQGTSTRKINLRNLATLHWRQMCSNAAKEERVDRKCLWKRNRLKLFSKSSYKATGSTPFQDWLGKKNQEIRTQGNQRDLLKWGVQSISRWWLKCNSSKGISGPPIISRDISKMGDIKATREYLSIQWLQ